MSILSPNQQCQSTEGAYEADSQETNTLSVLTAIFQVNLGQPVLFEAKDDGIGGDN